MIIVERKQARVWFGMAILSLASIVLSGCGVGTGGAGNAVSVTSVNGIVHGGPNPITNATVQLYATSSGGYGAAGTLLGTATTDGNGFFTFVSPASCPADQQAYITSYGGNTGSGTNGNYLLLAALGSCANINSTTNVWVSEATTVAAAYALNQFMTIGGTTSAPVVQIGAPANNNASSGSCTVVSGVTTACTSAGLAHAFANALNLANSVSIGATAPTGTIYVTTPSNPDGQVPTALINSLANSVEACVNSRGGVAGDGGYCGTLFQDATPPVSGATAPTNTLQALMDIAQYPALSGSNVAGVFNVATPQSQFFTPALTTAPNDWSLGIVYTGIVLSGANFPMGASFSLALDANDHVYITAVNTADTDSYVLAMGSDGTSLWSSTPDTANTTVRSIAADTLGHVWVLNNGGNAKKSNLLSYNIADGSGYLTAISTAAVSPFGLAIDRANNIWYGAQPASGQDVFELLQSSAYSSATLSSVPTFGNAINSVAIDANQNIWVESSAATGTNTVDVIPNAGTVAAPAYTAATITSNLTGESASGLALDNSGNAWTATVTSGLQSVAGNYTGVEVTSLGAAAATSVPATLPKYLGVDGAGTVWMVDQTAHTLTQYVPSQSPALAETLITCYAPNGATTCGNPLNSAIGIAKRAQADSDGSLWLAGSATGVTQIIGTAAPTWPQLSLGTPGKIPQ